MKQDEREKFQKLAFARASKPWGKAWAKLTQEMREAFVWQEAALIVISQALPEYAKAKALIRACVGQPLAADDD